MDITFPTPGVFYVNLSNYRYNRDGNITAYHNLRDGDDRKFTYDALNRLESIDSPNYDNGYYYNEATGNLYANGGYLYYEGSHPHAVTRASDGREFGYDANGNMTRRKIGGVEYTLTYDAENRLVAYTGGSIHMSFVYDGDGNRILARQTNGDRVGYVGDYEAVYNSAGTNTARRVYYRVGPARVMQGYGTVSGIRYLLGDHQGSTIAMASDTALLGTLVYTPWGFALNGSGSVQSEVRYTGQHIESSIGIYYYGARWYDPYLNRWLSPDSLVPDPSKPVDWDRFAYVRGNPLRYSDPSGHSACDVAGADPECNDPVVQYYANINERKEARRQVIANWQNQTSPFDGPKAPITPYVPYYISPSSSTPTTIGAPDRIYVSIDWRYIINWNKVDFVDAVVDVVGIGGDVAGYLSVPGNVVWGITEAPEAAGALADLVGFGINIYDLTVDHNPSGMSLTLAQEHFTNAIVDGYRLAPNYGFIFNLVSLGMNVIPAINPNSILIIGP